VEETLIEAGIPLASLGSIIPKDFVQRKNFVRRDDPGIFAT
jgi:hypothetical protein